MERDNRLACIYKILRNDYLLKILSSIILKIKWKDINNIHFVHGCINICTNKYFYKLQICGSGLEADIHNRNKLYKRIYPYIYEYKIISRKILCVRAPLCVKKRITDTHVEEIICCFRKYGKRVQFNYQKYESIKSGLNCLKQFRNGEKVNKLLCKYFANNYSEYIREGIVHGDLHSGNILFDKSHDKLILIDFDCTRMRDIQEIDLLYFYLQYEVVQHKYKLNWREIWLHNFGNILRVKEYGLVSKYVEMDLYLAWIILFLECIQQDEENLNYRKIMNRIILRITNYLQKINYI